MGVGDLPALWRALLVIAAVLPFFGCIHGQFLYDDRAVINPIVQGEVPWWHAFTADFWGLPMSSRFSHKSYRPLATLSFRVSAVLFGTGDTLSYHVVNTCLHAGNSLLVAALVRAYTASVTAAVPAALLFAVHPLHTETVSARASSTSSTLVTISGA